MNFMMQYLIFLWNKYRKAQPANQAEFATPTMNRHREVFLRRGKSAYRHPVKLLILKVFIMNLKEYQNNIKNKLRNIFPELDVETEWRIKVEQFNIYSPRLDLAVGPFSINNRNIINYDNLLNTYRYFFDKLIKIHNNNLHIFNNYFSQTNFGNLLHTNRNARCFIALEIENKVSRKHLLGGAVNASAIGRVGLFIAWSDEKFRAMVKLNGYFNFLKEVEKNTYNVDNLLILHRDQLIDFLNNNNQNQS